MNSTITLSPDCECRDRSTALSIFGALTVLCGGACVLLIAVMVLGQAMAPAGAKGPTATQTLVPGLVIYGGLAVVLVSLGIGSIMARRWARALLLIVSWSLMLLGILGIASLAFVMPKMLGSFPTNTPAGQPALPPGTLQIILTVTLLMFGFFFVLLPGVGVLFYGNRHVKRTCEVRDPQPRWTDQCPLPVLAVSLWLAAGVPMMLLMPLAYRSLLPFFGVFLTGVAGTVGYGVLAAISAWSARAFYRLDFRGWWLIAGSFSLFTVSNIVTYSRHDLMEVYRLMGYPETQIELMKQMSFLNSSTMNWGMGLFLVPVVAYLIYLRRYFRATASV